MDDLSFRKAIYADPNCKDPEILQAAKDDPSKQAFWDEVKAFNADIEHALQIEVPENLADKLLLRQSIKLEQKQNVGRPWYLAMAASLLLAAVISINMYTQTDSAVFKDALAHVNHVEAEVAKYGTVDLQTVNAKLANYNGSVSDGLGNILSANFCYLSNIRSLHIIIQGRQGLLSLFVLPEKLPAPLNEQFEDDKHQGTSFTLESHRLIVIGEDGDEVKALSELAKDSMAFSA